GLVAQHLRAARVTEIPLAELGGHARLVSRQPRGGSRRRLRPAGGRYASGQPATRAIVTAGPPRPAGPPPGAHCSRRTNPNPASVPAPKARAIVVRCPTSLPSRTSGAPLAGAGPASRSGTRRRLTCPRAVPRATTSCPR